MSDFNVSDFNLISVSLVKEPVYLNTIFMQAEKKTHSGRIYSNPISKHDIAVYKYDKAMKLLEMLNE